MLDSIPHNWWFGICDKVASSPGPSPWEGPEDKAMIKEADSEILKSRVVFQIQESIRGHVRWYYMTRWKQNNNFTEHLYW